LLLFDAAFREVAHAEGMLHAWRGLREPVT
jgi:hypothetical protein